MSILKGGYLIGEVGRAFALDATGPVFDPVPGQSALLSGIILEGNITITKFNCIFHTRCALSPWFTIIATCPVLAGYIPNFLNGQVEFVCINRFRNIPFSILINYP